MATNHTKVFDATLQIDVEDMSSAIKATLDAYNTRISANIMYNILQFFATNLMDDIRIDAAKRVEERINQNGN
jgi:hypothetical protein